MKNISFKRLCLSSIFILMPLVSVAQDISRSPAVVRRALRQAIASQDTGQVQLYLSKGAEVLRETDLTAQLNLTDDEIITISTGTVAKRKVSDEPVSRGEEAPYMLELPKQYVAPVKGKNEVVSVRPVVYEQQRLQYRENDEVFSGELLLLLEDNENPTGSKELGSPIRLKLLSPTARVQPDVVSLSETNKFSDPVRVRVQVPRDSLLISVVAAHDRNEVATYLPIEPALVFETASRPLQGWGVQSIPISVSIRGKTVTEPVTVRFESNAGSIKPEEVQIGASGFGRTTLRSEGTGRATVQAISPQFRSAELDFRYVFPYVFLVLSLFGGAVGGAISYQRAKHKSGNAVWKTHIIGGTLWGLVAAAAYLGLGVNLLGISLPEFSNFNEILVFIIAALGGVVWSMFSPVKGEAEPA